MKTKSLQTAAYRLTFVVLLLFLHLTGKAQNYNVGTTTTYEDGAFHTTAFYVTDTSYAALCAVVDEIYAGLQKKPTKDLAWMFENLGNHHNVENDLFISQKGVYFNPATNHYLLKLAIGMKKEDTPTVYDIEGTLTKGKTRFKEITLNITKKIKILNGAKVSVTAIPLKGGKTGVLVKSRIEFGWFFSMFFTQKRYRSIMEWRLQGVALHIKERAEGKR
ncbi:MAG: hypothetical protein MJZ24_01685 [Paludibacteraceae bacterium]|nr:hypothetical protein [Candidatus Physcocola equi]MCQ2233435.1 hypothetical protein [Paludibacteraceae bacterium]